ncbi:MAG TPA: tetratricopeptide repeat protein [Candidatus Binataceae bacterium]|nr:tetratricopeptide repeat protein [Candidatus Binataceae bacterium]
MPSSSQHKLTRKELKQPDEFESLLDNIGTFVVENLQQVLVSLGVVAAVGAIALGVYYYEAHRDAVAGEQFYTALDRLKSKNYKDAEAGFSKLADQEPGRQLGKLARFYLANAYLEDNNLPQARDTFAQFVSEDHDPLYMNLALTNLGVIYERMGDYKKAASAYGQAASVPGPEQMRAEISVARVLAKAGDKQGAIAAYRGFLAAHPYAQQRQDVQESLAELGATDTASASSASTIPATSIKSGAFTATPH